MNRRRLYVFGTIIIVGILIGIFCLPESGENEENGELERGGRKADDGRLPVADMGDTRGARIQMLVEKARSTPHGKARAAILRQAYDIDPTSTWGGEAAAGLARYCKKEGEVDNARWWYKAAMRATLPLDTLANVDAELGAMRRESAPPAVSRVKLLSYKVQPRDSLWLIARRYATTIDAIKQVNRLRSDVIRPRTVLRVPKGPFDVLITKHNHTLQLLQAGKTVKVYSVGLGVNGSTPTGNFVVTSALRNPIWYSGHSGRIPAGDPRNVLGSRWIGFCHRIGIHGSRKRDEHTIGKDASEGCVRMRDEDVKELFNFITIHKSKVTVVK